MSREHRIQNGQRTHELVPPGEEVTQCHGKETLKRRILPGLRGEEIHFGGAEGKGPQHKHPYWGGQKGRTHTQTVRSPLGVAKFSSAAARREKITSGVKKGEAPIKAPGGKKWGYSARPGAENKFGRKPITPSLPQARNAIQLTLRWLRSQSRRRFR